MADFRRIICLMVAGLTIVKECSCACNFPQSWSSQQWMTKRTNHLSRTIEIITYNQTHIIIKTNTGTSENTYDCDSFETVNGHQYYIRVDSGSNRVCVDDYEVQGQILHRESGVVTSLANCKTSFNAVDLYDIYLKAQYTTASYTLESVSNCPFENIPYQVSFVTGSNHECVGDPTSSSTVNRHYISLLACKYQQYPRIPLTGTIRCLSSISPSDLGEANGNNGGAVIIEWRTNTQKTAFAYCARYNNATGTSGRDMKLSIDITSTSQVTCLRNANYDWSKTEENRDYARIDFTYKSSLVSSSPVIPTNSPSVPGISTTTSRAPTPSTASTPGPTVTPAPTAPAILPAANVQFVLDMPISEIPNQTNDFKQKLRESISSETGLDISKIKDITTTTSKDGKVVVTVLIEGHTDVMLTNLRDKFNQGQYVFQTPANKNVSVVARTFYTWRDTDNCSTAKCENGGKCRIDQGTYLCVCVAPYTGPVCSAKAEPTVGRGLSSTALYAIIAVCVLVALAVIIGIIVFVIKRQDKNKQHDESELGYDNAGTIDDRDRELYSTINKKPKAYHDKSFTSAADENDHGELTGIHL